MRSPDGARTIILVRAGGLCTISHDFESLALQELPTWVSNTANVRQTHQAIDYFKQQAAEQIDIIR